MKHLIVILLFVVGCTSTTEKQEITSLEAAENAYLNAYEEVVLAYEKEPSDQLLEQKLYYLDKLGWPVMAIEALDQAKQSMGLSQDLVARYVLYYEKNEQYAPMMELLNGWGKMNSLDAKMMESNITAHMLLAPRENTLEQINNYLYEYQEPGNLGFAGEKLLQLGDTLMSVYYYSRLHKQDPLHKDLVKYYVPLMLKIGQPARARSILSYHAETDTSAQTRLLLARTLFQIGDKRKAKGILRSHNDPESLDQLTRWYWSEKRWDSTTFFVDKLIQIDSTEQALMMKASIFEEQGSLSSALTLLNILVQRDSSNNIARETADDVSRKITYLRRLEANKNKSIPEITPKTSLNNE